MGAGKQAPVEWAKLSPSFDLQGDSWWGKTGKPCPFLGTASSYSFVPLPLFSPSHHLLLQLLWPVFSFHLSGHLLTCTASSLTASSAACSIACLAEHLHYPPPSLPSFPTALVISSIFIVWAYCVSLAPVALPAPPPPSPQQFCTCSGFFTLSVLGLSFLKMSAKTFQHGVTKSWGFPQ